MNNNQKLDGLHILIVEDDPKGLDLLRTLLKFHGAQVSAAVNGFQGLSFAKELQPKLIISDLSMPVMNGWKMIKELKQDHTTSDIPIIALTAHAMRGDREKAMAVGCNDYLTKPVDPYTFVDSVISILENMDEFTYLRS